MRIRIVSLGSGHTTRVEDVDTGATIEQITEVYWSIPGPASVATAVLVFANIEVDVIGELTMERENVPMSELQEDVQRNDPEQEMHGEEPGLRSSPVGDDTSDGGDQEHGADV